MGIILFAVFLGIIGISTFEKGGWLLILIIGLGLAFLLVLGLLQPKIEKSVRERYEHLLDEEKKNFEKIIEQQEHERLQALVQKEKLLQQKEEEFTLRLQFQQKLFEEKTKGFPWVAEAYGRFMSTPLKQYETYFLTKSRPSYKSAEIVRALQQQVAALEKNTFIYKGILDYYTTMFPWLKDFIDIPDEEICLDNISVSEEADNAKKFLSPIEWDKLSRVEKFQTALDRYQKKHKTNWEIGRDFERYVGYTYEQNGWDVDFFGAIKSLEDLGRDLICKKKNQVQIVQCKYWAYGKIIHEKHIFQLFGSCVQYSIEHQQKPKGVFITSASLSEMAKKCAHHLSIEVRENIKMESIPCIKCNIGSGGEKIYHLPFDQMYDRVKITPSKGECYCSTVADAEAKGFRRAHRWSGEH